MRVVIQRVAQAQVVIAALTKSAIQNGLLILLGIEDTDTEADADHLIAKAVSLRIFSDEKGLMNLSVKDIQGEILIVSQFTLFASTKKGNRPSFLRAARPEKSLPLYEYFITQMQAQISKKIQTGEFGADMQVQLINDGPVTILIDSKQRE